MCLLMFALPIVPPFFRGFCEYKLKTSKTKVYFFPNYINDWLIVNRWESCLQLSSRTNAQAGQNVWDKLEHLGFLLAGVDGTGLLQFCEGKQERKKERRVTLTVWVIIIRIISCHVVPAVESTVKYTPLPVLLLAHSRRESIVLIYSLPRNSL